MRTPAASSRLPIGNLLPRREREAQSAQWGRPATPGDQIASPFREIVRPLLRTMQHAQDSDGFAGHLVDGDVRRAGDDKLARPGDSTPAGRSRENRDDGESRTRPNLVTDGRPDQGTTPMASSHFRHSPASRLLVAPGVQPSPFTGGVPWVWKLGIVFSPQAWPFFRSASVQVTGSQSGCRISLAPAFATSTRLPAGSYT